MVKQLSMITALILSVAVMGGVTSANAQTTAIANEPPQVQWVGDVPINPELEIEKGLGFAFDSPEGRVVMVFLSGGVSAAEMATYYGQALEPLGWDAAGDMRWRREGEMLLINKTAAAGAMLWKITLRPE